MQALSTDIVVAITQFLTLRNIASLARSCQALRSLSTLRLLSQSSKTFEPSPALARRQSLYLTHPDSGKASAGNNFDVFPQTGAESLGITEALGFMRRLGHFTSDHELRSVRFQHLREVIGVKTCSLSSLHLHWECSNFILSDDVEKQIVQPLLAHVPNLVELVLEYPSEWQWETTALEAGTKSTQPLQETRRFHKLQRLHVRSLEHALILRPLAPNLVILSMDGGWNSSMQNPGDLGKAWKSIGLSCRRLQVIDADLDMVQGLAMFCGASKHVADFPELRWASFHNPELYDGQDWNVLDAIDWSRCQLQTVALSSSFDLELFAVLLERIHSRSRTSHEALPLRCLSRVITEQVNVIDELAKFGYNVLRVEASQDKIYRRELLGK